MTAPRTGAKEEMFGSVYLVWELPSTAIMLFTPQVSSGIAATPAPAAAATLDVAIQRGLSHRAQR